MKTLSIYPKDIFVNLEVSMQEVKALHECMNHCEVDLQTEAVKDAFPVFRQFSDTLADIIETVEK